MTGRLILVAALAFVAAAAGCASTRTTSRADRPDAGGGRGAGARTGPQTSSSAGVGARAEEILGGGGALAEWRPALKADLERHLDEIGALGPARILLHDLDNVARLAPARPADNVERAAMVGPTTMATRGERVLVVCREGEFDTLESSVVVCLGDLRVRSVRNCVLFVRGRMEADQIETATICGGGTVDARTTRETAMFDGSRRGTR